MKRFVEGTCVDYTFDGQGVVKLSDGKPLFVPGMIKGEVGVISFVETNKSFYNGKLERFTSLSPSREIPKCLLYSFCGGCQIMHMSYIEQCAFKTHYVEETLKRIGGIDNIVVNPIVKNPNPFKYRNKVQVAYSKDFKGRICGGFYMEGTNKVVNRDSCYLEDEKADEVSLYFRSLIEEYKVDPYDKGTQSGFIKNLLVRTSSLGEVMVVIVTKGKSIPHKQEIVKKLVKRFPCIKSIVHNINPSSSQGIILGKEEYVIYGQGYINDILCGLKFKISPKSFFQINHDQTENLYNYAIKMAGLTGKETVLDAYCGIGTIGLIASKKAKAVVGVEIVEDAIINAKENAIINNITNTTHYALDATKFILEEEKKNNRFDVVFIDPPRGGCDEAFLNSLIKTKPDRIVYISCNPSTLARDLKLLKEVYDINDVQPFDMFSQTYHVESVVCLTRKNTVEPKCSCLNSISGNCLNSSNGNIVQ